MQKPTYKNSPEELDYLITAEKFEEFYKYVKTHSDDEIAKYTKSSHVRSTGFTKDALDTIKEMASFFVRSPEITPAIEGFWCVSVDDMTVAYVNQKNLGVSKNFLDSSELE